MKILDPRKWHFQHFSTRNLIGSISGKINIFFVELSINENVNKLKGSSYSLIVIVKVEN